MQPLDQNLHSTSGGAASLLPDHSLSHRLRLPALACSVLWLAAELIARPFAETGVADDWSYMKSAEILLHTGHVVYNGWATAMLGWQLYLGAAFLAMFGDSYAALRSCVLIMAVLIVFLLQRTMVRCGLTERNASLATLALTLTPLYMELSATFMTDIPGLLTVLVCLYACIRALQSAPGSSARMTWLLFAILGNGLLGTCRQIAWLGVLIMVPSALWLMRRDRRALITGGIACLVSWTFIAVALHWLNQQPYIIPEHLLITVHGIKEAGYMVREMLRALLMIPFLMFALSLAFLPELRRASRRFLIVVAVVLIGYTALAAVVARSHGPNQMLQPILGDWTGPQGFYAAINMAEPGPVILITPVRMVLTAISLLGMFAMIAFVLRLRRTSTQSAEAPALPGVLSWTELGWLLWPFSIVNLLLLIPRSATRELDRYLVEVVIFLTILLVRAYQEREQPELPRSTLIAVAAIALFSIANLHDMFSLYRARHALAEEFRASGRPERTLDIDWQYDSEVELKDYAAINDDKIINPPHWFKFVDVHRGESCDGKGDIGFTLAHQEPYFGVAFSPTACAGADPAFAPVAYTRWLGLTQTPLYIVRYRPYVLSAVK